MSLERRIQRKRDRAVSSADSRLLAKALASTDGKVREERLRIIEHVREAARHVHESDLDKFWAFLEASRKDYTAEKDGLSVLMACVDNWRALDELEKEEPPPSSGSSKFPFNQDSAWFYEPETDLANAKRSNK